MQTISANDVKTRGIEQALSGDDEALVTLRGKPAYVIVDIERYNHLRDCELSQALAEAKADIAAGRYTTNIDQHMAEVTEGLERVKRAAANV